MISVSIDDWRMWMHCPLQAKLCRASGRLPRIEIERSCVVQALGQAYCEGDLDLERLGVYCDQAWTRARPQLSLEPPEFIERGIKLLTHAQRICRILMKLRDSGWLFKGANVPLSNSVEIEGENVFLSHTADLALGRRGVEGQIYVTVKIGNLSSAETQREARLSAENLFLSMVAPLPQRSAFVFAAKDGGQTDTTLDVAERDRALEMLRQFVLSHRHGIWPQRTVSRINCAGCPEQVSCDGNPYYGMQKGALA